MGGARRGRAIGIRIDPATGAGYKPHLEYSGDRPTKFGIGLERFDDALAAAARHDLAIDTIHFHAGSGWLAEGLAAFERALPAAVEAVERARAAGHEIVEVNVGGGLGVPARVGRDDGRPRGVRGRSSPGISGRSGSPSPPSRAMR